MKKFLLAILIFVSGCATQSGEVVPAPTSVPTPAIKFTKILKDFSLQDPLVIKEKKEALYTYNVQVVDNGLSLHAEEANPKCHKAADSSGVRAPMTINLTFKNLTSRSITISDRFASHSWAPSGYVGADFTIVFFQENGERLYTGGDSLDYDYDPGPLSFMDLSANENYTKALEFEFPFQVGKGDGILWELPSGYYFVKFIYWTTQMKRVLDEGGPHPGIGPAISSNPIVVCVE